MSLKIDRSVDDAVLATQEEFRPIFEFILNSKDRGTAAAWLLGMALGAIHEVGRSKDFSDSVMRIVAEKEGGR